MCMFSLMCFCVTDMTNVQRQGLGHLRGGRMRETERVGEKKTVHREFMSQQPAEVQHDMIWSERPSTHSHTRSYLRDSNCWISCWQTSSITVSPLTCILNTSCVCVCVCIDLIHLGCIICSKICNDWYTKWTCLSRSTCSSSRLLFEAVGRLKCTLKGTNEGDISYAVRFQNLI